jgi:hypothetical protein
VEARFDFGCYEHHYDHHQRIEIPQKDGVNPIAANPA